MPTFRTPAATPFVLYANEVPGTANQPCTFTCDATTKVTLTPATDGRSVSVSCNNPAITAPLGVNVTAKTPQGIQGTSQVVFDVDPSIATAVTLSDTPA